MSNQHRSGGNGTNKSKRPRRRWLGYSLLLLLGIFLGVLVLASAFLYRAYKTLPAMEEFDPSQTSVILDYKGEMIYKLAAEGEDRTVLKEINQIPKDVQKAFVATEDRRFYDHHGIDFVRLGGAVWSDIKYVLGVKGSQLEGGSTITMQLARNAFLTLDQTPMRKVQEMMIAVELERQYTKDEILLQYLNQVDFGYQAAGLDAAAHRYFSKAAKDLTLSEGALLAGILKGPSEYSPLDNYNGAMGRRTIVLDLMAEQGYIDAQTANRMKQEKVVLNPAKVTATSVTFNGDWYVDYVIKALSEPDEGKKYGLPTFKVDDLYSKGLKIYTAMDPKAQKIAQEKLEALMPAGTKQYGGKEVPEAAVVIRDPASGAVRAIIGGMKHENMRGYNRATDAHRQPGSSIKPLAAYLPAIDSLGWGPATVIDDSPLMLNNEGDNVWPENYEFRYMGLQPMRWGLEQSINAMAVRSIVAVGPKKALEYARKMGLESLIDASQAPKDNPNAHDEHAALALGGLTRGVTPLEMSSAYATLANLGLKVEPVVITKIVDKYGKTVYESGPPKKEQVVRKESVWLMVDVMKGAILRGTASYESQGFHGWPAAGKTGTTENWQDAWFNGFTPNLVVSVWTGYDDASKRLPGRTGYAWTGAGPPTAIWTAIMNELVKEKPADWARPSGLTQVEVCKTTGLLPNPLCPQDQIVTDWFRTGFEPKTMDNVLTTVKVVKQPFVDPKTNKQIVDSVTKKPIERYYLWQEGCAGTPETLALLKRPTTYVRHPKDPYNFGKYWPADWWREVPTEKCKSLGPPDVVPPGYDPSVIPPGYDPSVIPPGTGTTQPGTGTTQPGTGTTQPGTGTTQPGTGTTQPGTGTTQPGTGTTQPGTGVTLPGTGVTLPVKP